MEISCHEISSLRYLHLFSIEKKTNNMAFYYYTIPIVAAVVIVLQAVQKWAFGFPPSCSRVGNHTASSHDLGQITTGHHRGWLIVDAWKLREPGST